MSLGDHIFLWTDIQYINHTVTKESNGYGGPGLFFILLLTNSTMPNNTAYIHYSEEHLSRSPYRYHSK